MARNHPMRLDLGAPEAGVAPGARERGVSPRIDLQQLHLVSAWSQALGCSEERLRRAIAAVGPEVQEVCNHLGISLPARSPAPPGDSACDHPVAQGGRASVLHQPAV